MQLFKHDASLIEIEDFIVNVRGVAPFLVGEPGVGKTAMFDRVVARTGYRGVYMNVPELDIGDIGVPMPNHETKTTSLYPNEYWGFHTGEPLVIFMDEFTKGDDAVKKILHPLINEGRIGPCRTHEDTICVLTGNNSTDGVGDVIKAHTVNRITEVHVRKPSSEEWRAWGAENDIEPLVLAAAKQYEDWFASYKDQTSEGNEAIFNPKFPDRPFVSPRSLARSSKIVARRHLITENMLRVSLAGTIGKVAAEQMASFFTVADALPTWEEIMENPDKAKLPDSPAAQCILAYSALQRIDRASVSKWFTYMKRTSSELQSVFCLTGMKSDTKKDLLMSSKAFVDWMREKQYLF